jgi:hypothetical protein
MSDTQDMERIRAKAEQHHRAYQRISELTAQADAGVWGLEDTGEMLELNRELDYSGFTLDDVEALLHIIDRQQAVIQAARQMAGTYLWQDEAAAKAQYHLRGVLREYDALAALEGAQDGEGA